MWSPEVEHLFALCDSEGKGFLTVDDLKKICPQLDDKDIAFIFKQLDIDKSGKIDKMEFCKGFEAAVSKGETNGLNGMQRRASISYDDHIPQILRDEQVFDSDAESTLRPNHLRVADEDLYLSESDTNHSIDFAVPCQDEVLMLYEQLQSTGMPQLLRKFEKVVGSFYKEIKEKKHENERLQHICASEKEMYNRRMEEVEIELDQQLEMAERKAREEERQRLTKEKEEMRAHLTEELREMRQNIEHLQKMEHVLEKESEKLTHQKELNEKLKEVNQENAGLRKNLAENHLELAMIKSELAHVRANYDEKQNELLERRDQMSNANEESETLQKQLHLLFDANKKLHETNESLRDALDSRAAVLRQFNLRTPSPSVLSRDSLATPQSSFSPASRLFSPVALHAISSDDIDTPLILDDSHSHDEKTNAKDLIGIHEASGPAERTFRIVMCGDAAVGKSSFVMRVIRRQFTNQLPSTLGVDFHVKTVNVDGHNVALQLWDTAGQERFRSLCKSYFRRADGAILVYDVTAEHTLLRVRDWIDTIKESVERSIPIILVGNKCDLRRDGGGVAKADGASMAAAMGVLFMETSALDGSNIDNAMLALTRELMAVEDVEIRATGVVLSPREKQKQTGSTMAGGMAHIEINENELQARTRIVRNYMKDRDNCIVLRIDKRMPDVENMNPFGFHFEFDEKKYKARKREIRLRRITRLFSWLAYYHHKFGIRHITLFSLLVIYVFLGGLIFEKLESPHEIADLKQTIILMQGIINEETNDIINITLSTNGTDRRNQLGRLIKRYYKTMLEAEGRFHGSVWHKAENLDMHLMWYFSSATFYSMTLFSTIGYGTITCQTFWGRTVSMIYASLGLPLMLVVLGDVGEWFQKILTKAYIFCYLKYKDLRRQKVTKDLTDLFLPMWIALGLVLAYILICTLMIKMFDHNEGNKPGIGFFDAFYFTFISLTTIGLGDVMPYNIQYSPFLAAAFLLGLALISIVNTSIYAQLYKIFFNLIIFVEDSLERIHSSRHDGPGYRIFQDLEPVIRMLVCTFPQVDAEERALLATACRNSFVKRASKDSGHLRFRTISDIAAHDGKHLYEARRQRRRNLETNKTPIRTHAPTLGAFAGMSLKNFQRGRSRTAPKDEDGTESDDSTNSA
ncbi:unnamed protein product [Caenorhabditis auriculariae]|uniref:Ras and EF-hand domain-containing protein homolog n=1 Tax=Caenorhabditis auriculariae TaxID=2777116 RepID=A0A8S1GWD9_9PELO|nr:unnamed protein product [Caenorhabditis auriculariae]